jgi:hypothetical protein
MKIWGKVRAPPARWIISRFLAASIPASISVKSAPLSCSSRTAR